MTPNSASVCLHLSDLRPPRLPLAPRFVQGCQSDGGICLFMNTEVTCNQAERAQAALCFGSAGDAEAATSAGPRLPGGETGAGGERRRAKVQRG